ncbi:hypothetical protein GTP44_14300 [Duganella sp. FT50W]|uniref:Uncharacterized protein n=1 Tax=Duganella lactea TaxID=2692173 RepID=A0A6L8MJK4_9BURK|nr:hypothetical protein [Duganella lactea]MYM83123.1 hypothetical protein [Duganella lactea]
MMNTKHFTTRRTLLTAAGASLVASTLSACGGGGGSPTPAPPPPPTPTPPPAQTIGLSLSGSQMLGSAPVSISAALGVAADVSWALAGGNPGALSANSGASVSYTPPATRVSAITPVTVTASASGISQSVRLALYPDAGAPGLSLLAGSLAGRAIIDGVGAAARFNNIVALANDGNGAVLVADLAGAADGSTFYPSTIRQISASGAVTTLFAPARGHADGNGADARLGKVSAMAVAPDSSIYLVDWAADTYYLRRLTRAGALSTVATLSPPLTFSSARVVVDGNGAVTVLTSRAVYRVNGDTLALAAGSETDFAGSVDDAGVAARFTAISDAVAAGNGDIYVIDNFSIRKVAANNSVSTLAGVATAASPSIALDGAGSAARFGRPVSLAFNTGGQLLVLDREDAGRTGYLIRQVSLAGVVTTPYRGTDPKNFSALGPAGTATPNRSLTVTSNNAIVLASTGQLQTQSDASSATLLAGLENDSDERVDGQGAAARFVNPAYLAADLSGNIYVAERAGAVSGRLLEPTGLWLRKISATGQVSTLVAVANQLTVTGLAADADGNVYVSTRFPRATLIGEAPGGYIHKVSPQGVVAEFAGGKPMQQPAPVDGAGAEASFTGPTLEGIDSSGNLYVTDVNRWATPAATVLRKVTPQGVVSTISALPAGLNKAPDGNFYSADAASSVLYRLDANGIKTVVAGVAGQRGTRLGTLPGGMDAPPAMIATGPDSFAVISGAAVLRLVLPH